MPKTHPALIAATSQLAECVAAQKKFDQAEQLWSQACELMKDNPSVTGKQRQAVIEHIAECYEGASRPEDAARWRQRLASQN